MRVQPYVMSEDGKLFDVTLNMDDITVRLLEYSKEEIMELLGHIQEQVELLEEGYI